jgi:membrane-associated phospholipid phosphatase
VKTSPSPAADRERVWAPVLATAGGAHFAALWAVGGAGWDYLALDGLLVGLALAGGRALFLARTAFPLWLTGVLYLNLQPVLLPLRGPILTGQLFALDAALFPAPGGGGWPAFFSRHPRVALDVVAGLAYLVYLLEFFAVFLFFHFRERPIARRMAWCFLAVNVLGIAGYVLFPAAPPWYVLAHGPGPAELAAAPSAAGAARFDALFGIRYFAAFYAKNPNVFGAMPSLHVAYPTIAACFLARRGLVPAALGAVFAAWVAFSAVYLVHHYVLDVVAGAAVGLAAFALVEGFFRAAPAIGGAR